MLFNSSASASLWVDAFSSATYIIIHLPSKVLANRSPFETLFGVSPNYDIFEPMIVESFRIYKTTRRTNWPQELFLASSLAIVLSIKDIGAVIFLRITSTPSDMINLMKMCFHF